jgi:hypothetical protein
MDGQYMHTSYEARQRRFDPHVETAGVSASDPKARDLVVVVGRKVEALARREVLAAARSTEVYLLAVCERGSSDASFQGALDVGLCARVLSRIAGEEGGKGEDLTVTSVGAAPTRVARPVARTRKVAVNCMADGMIGRRGSRGG